MEKKDFYDLIRSVPKAELHLHAEAVIRSSTIKELYHHSTGMTMDEKKLEKIFDYEDLPGFLESFLYIQSLYNTSDELLFMFKDFKSYLNENNIVYTETFFSPTMHVKKGRKYEDMVKIIQKSVDSVAKEDHRTIKVLIDVSRSFGKENAMNNLDALLKYREPCIIGIGLGGDEAKGKATEFTEVYAKARENGLHTVVHAGEVCPSQSIKDSIDYLKAERIGHGISAAFDQDMMDYLKKTQLPLEISPTSNVFTKKYVKDIKDHPIKKLYDNGVNITLATDDPVFFKVNLLDEYWNLYDKLGFKLEEIKEILLNGFRDAFITDEEKEAYIAQANEAWDKWFKENPSN